MRARMIELSWSGLRVPAIAMELGCSQKTVRRWLHRRLATTVATVTVDKAARRF
ncbi:helix-turn-helix domain-containing protein [Streptomyces sp. NPDC048643]|uniref:helix-turn-helix domain-containing protein n=1 Tax=Streptomyces sp. NPDC048643 TaxID=3155637 RepID=UPI003421EAB5